MIDNKMLYFTKTRDVKNPSYGTPGSVGIDFYMPEHSDEFMQDLIAKNEWLNNFQRSRSSIMTNMQRIKETQTISIPPHKDLCVPSGIKMRLPEGTALVAFNKSGIATKKKLIKGAELVDWDYQGEIHCHVINTTDDCQEVEFGKKIVQFVLMPVIMANLQMVGTVEELYPEETERGEKWQGSTDRK